MLVDCRRFLPVSHRLLVLTLRRKCLELAHKKTVCGPVTLWISHPLLTWLLYRNSCSCVLPRERPQGSIVSYLEWNPGFHAWQQVSLSGPNTLGHLHEGRLGSPPPPRPLPPIQETVCVQSGWLSLPGSWRCLCGTRQGLMAPCPSFSNGRRGPERQRALLGGPSVESWSFIAAQPRAFTCAWVSPPTPLPTSIYVPCSTSNPQIPANLESC